MERGKKIKKNGFRLLFFVIVHFQKKIIVQMVHFLLYLYVTWGVVDPRSF